MLSKYTCIILLLTIGCTPQAPVSSPKTTITNFYSPSVKDTFSIFVQLPDDDSDTTTYPVLYVLDANLYFDIFSGILKKYSEVGLLSPAILVGIGYRDFPTMDSLRNRDCRLL